MATDEAAFSDSYDATHLIIAKGHCATSGVMGSQSMVANGVNRTTRGIFMSVSADQVSGPCTGFACPMTSNQRTMAHELIHFAGKGGHSSAYECLDEPSNTLKCPQTEYMDVYDIMGTPIEQGSLGAQST